jgi:hypothetical protein
MAVAYVWKEVEGVCLELACSHALLLPPTHIHTSSPTPSLSPLWQVTLSDGNEYRAKVIGVDPEKDIAVLQLDPSTVAEKKALIKPLQICNDPTSLQVVRQEEGGCVFREWVWLVLWSL